MEEIWRDIKGYEGIYQVSNFGRIRSRYSKSGKKLISEYHILKPVEQKTGYLRVTIGRKNKNIHRLVAETFLNNFNNLPQVNHKNGNKKDNSLSNLEWVNNKQNAEHALRTGLIKTKKIRMYNIKTGETIDFNIRSDIEKYLQKKVCQDLITRCCNKQRKTAYGMRWEYK